VLTGLSGSGKSQAIRALEDLGYFCVDNLPTTLIPTLAKLSLRGGRGIDKVAIVVDVREGGFLSSFPGVFRQLRRMPKLNPVLIFLEASHAALVRRFSETRRPHPLAPDRSVAEGIRDERSRLNVIRDLADEIIDTSDMTVHQLRQFFMNLSPHRPPRPPPVVPLPPLRHPHPRPPPLAPDRSVAEGIRDERSRLNVIRDLADEIIDTSDMTVHELRQFFMNLSRDRSSSARLVVTLLSFGYKHGVPLDADLLFDV